MQRPIHCESTSIEANQVDNHLPVEQLREDLRPFSPRMTNMLEALWQSPENPLGQDMG